MLEQQLRDEDHGSGMQPSLASGGSPSTTQLQGVEWRVQALVQLSSVCRDMDGVCCDGPETLPYEGAGYNPFSEGTWGSNGSVGHVAPAVVPWLPNGKDQQELERGLDGEKLRRGEESEQKGKDKVCEHGEQQQEEMLQSQRNEKAIGRKVTEGRK